MCAGGAAPGHQDSPAGGGFQPLCSSCPTPSVSHKAKAQSVCGALSACLRVSVCISPLLCLSVCFALISLSLHPFVSLPISLFSVPLCLSLSLSFLCLSESLSLFLYFCLHLSSVVCLSLSLHLMYLFFSSLGVRLSLSLSVSGCVSLCLSPFLSLLQILTFPYISRELMVEPGNEQCMSSDNWKSQLSGSSHSHF